MIDELFQSQHSIALPIHGTLRKSRQSHNKANRQEENELYNHDHKKFETTILHNDHFNNLDVADGGGGVGSGPDDRCDCSDRIPSHITIVDNNNIKTASTTIIIVVAVVFIVIGRGINVKNSFS